VDPLTPPAARRVAAGHRRAAADAAGSRVTVTFTPVGDGTLVSLVHDRLDAHGTGWEQVRAAVDSDGGWPGLLREYAEIV
jgi:uncharacterized protein YndB with AHSA1/START domain